MTYTIKLRHDGREFSAISSHKHQQVFARRISRPWLKVIILLHGFPDNNTSYVGVWPILAEAFPLTLLLAPAMRGYEPSSVGKDSEYRISDLANDVKAWLEQLGDLQGVPVHLVGHDWGAIAAYKTAMLFPELLTSMVTLAIPLMSNIKPWELAVKCPQQLYLSSYFFTMQYRFLYGPKFHGDYLDQLWRYWSPTWKFTEQDIGPVRETLAQPGVLDAATAYYRCLFRLANIKDRKWIVDFEKVPTLILGGEADGCMSSRLLEIQRGKLAGNPNVKVQTMAGLGHFLHREDPRKVGEAIVEWLKTHS